MRLTWGGSAGLEQRLPLDLSWRSALVLAGLAVLAVPTMFSLAREHWSTENGAHGPIILATGLWLFVRERSALHLRSTPLSWWWLLPMLLLLLLYGFGRSFEILSLESAALYALTVLTAAHYWDRPTFRNMWFPLLYVGFLVKPPSSIVAELTQPLKIALSDAAVRLLSLFNYPVGRSGVLIQIDQYELLVQQACAGLGSLVSLLAIGILYAHLSNRSGILHLTMLILGILPVAVIANFIRILILVLLTYHEGDAVAQSFAHDVAGLFTFTLSMLGLFGLDLLLRPWSRPR